MHSFYGALSELSFMMQNCCAQFNSKRSLGDRRSGPIVHHELYTLIKVPG